MASVTECCKRYFVDRARTNAAVPPVAVLSDAYTRYVQVHKKQVIYRLLLNTHQGDNASEPTLCQCCR